MSIPDRLWRVVKGQWALAEERRSLTRDHADAMQELADFIRQPPATPPVERGAGGGPVLPQVSSPTPSGQHDPLEACYVLLGVQPGASLVDVQQAYESRRVQLRPEQFLPGTPERAAVDARQSALQVAYERLRDSLNPTETRFEHLEF